MDNKDNNSGHDMKMMWLMMLPCLLMPIILLTFLGRGIDKFNWQIFIGVAIMVVLHALLMKFMHHGNEKTCLSNKEKERETE